MQEEKLKNLLDNETLETPSKTATHVNQRSNFGQLLDGHSYNCEYRFDCDNLNREQFHEQFTQVVMCCEFVGSRVLGFVCDAGGSNVGLMKYLRQMKAYQTKSGYPRKWWSTRTHMTHQEKSVSFMV